MVSLRKLHRALLKARSISSGLIVTFTPALLCLFALSSALYSVKSWGQATDTIHLKPALKINYQPIGYFDTPQQAYAVYQAQFAANCARSPGWVCTVDSLQPCTGVGASYYWGTPVTWCTHFRQVSPSGEVEDGIIAIFSYIEACPTHANFSTDRLVTNLVSGTGQAGDPRYYQDYCEEGRAAILPKEPSLGDPTYPSSGTQFQLATDYSSGDGVLTFNRYYDNAYRRFRSEYEVAFVPPNQALGSTCIVSQIWEYDQNGNMVLYDACFTILNIDPLNPGTGAVFTDFKGARDELSWNATDGFSTSWDFKSHLTTAMIKGAQTWLLLRPGDNLLRGFNNAGQLQFTQRPTAGA